MIDRHSSNGNGDSKPYCALGAGSLSSFIWKRPNEAGLARYDFNVVRVSQQSGRTSHLLRHCDFTFLVKLIALLATVIEEDGCLKKQDRSRLKDLAFCLQTVADRYS